MVVSKIKAVIPCGIEKVWRIVTDYKDYSWRSDLNRTEIVGENKFVEYTKSGYPTVFTVTAEEPLKRWEFDLDNSNIYGHWIGTFISSGSETEVEFTECIYIKKKYIMKAFVKLYLRKQQRLFIADLRRAK